MKRLIQHLNARNLTLLLILLPTVLCVGYLYLFAADRYVSESSLTVKQSGDQAIGLAGIASIFQVSGSNARSDLLMLQTYVQSADMLHGLEERLHLHKAYSAPTRDFLLRLGTNASQDQFLAYYRDRIDARFDDTAGLLVLRTQGFTAAEAVAINRTIIELSEAFINAISQRMAEEQMGFARGELKKATNRLEVAKKKMFAFQEKHHMLDPMSQVRANSVMTVELQARMTRLEADYRAARSYMDENSYQVRALREQLEALRQQLEAESSRGTSETKAGPRLNTLAGEFRELEIELNFSEEAYKSTSLSMETARLETTRKIKTLVKVASPTTPQDAEYPRRLYNTFALLLAFCLVYGIVRLMVATIEDHLD